MSAADTAHSIGLMRVNHVGEVCAQALYSGQAWMAKDPAVRALLQKSAQEEKDHLAWCATRLQQLQGSPSKLNIIWYMGAFVMGVTAGALGDRRSLSFVAETESQVNDHLQHHLSILPDSDAESRSIVTAMQQDEVEHGENARQAGGSDVPIVVKHVMNMVSKIMTTVAYKI
jgi:ubiquinone biosynthesis monooxygenase Coq7